MHEEFGYWLTSCAYRVKFFFNTKVPMWVAFRAPKWLVSWCYIRVVSFATTGKYGATLVSEITALEAYDRWLSA